ncbi:hypothetical protein [Sporisorium scitamineum]|uniref:Uncharacterized protein n=1 Tax=Sporisorium scitamineum TaxID=49012 RepID=A0A0F7S5X7_9BASI|nr:hypothetical protein [Sporisorium scitamineum]
MVKVRALIGIIAALSFAISGPVKPPDERTLSGQAGHALFFGEAVQAPEPVKHLLLDPKRRSPTRQDVMRDFDLRPQDPEFEPLVAFLWRNERLFDHAPNSGEAARHIANLYNAYRSIYTTKGDDLKEHENLIPALLNEDQHNSRISDMAKITQ